MLRIPVATGEGSSDKVVQQVWPCPTMPVTPLLQSRAGSIVTSRKRSCSSQYTQDKTIKAAATELKEGLLEKE